MFGPANVVPDVVPGVGGGAGVGSGVGALQFSSMPSQSWQSTHMHWFSGFCTMYGAHHDEQSPTRSPLQISAQFSLYSLQLWHAHNQHFFSQPIPLRAQMLAKFSSPPMQKSGHVACASSSSARTSTLSRLPFTCSSAAPPGSAHDPSPASAGGGKATGAPSVGLAATGTASAGSASNIHTTKPGVIR